jgi:hypothetical protein
MDAKPACETVFFKKTEKNKDDLERSVSYMCHFSVFI